MKKKIIYLAVFLMTVGISPLFAATTEAHTPNATSTEVERSTVLNQRLIEINELDKSSISHTEKRSLRKEVKAIEKELKGLNNGVYISVGGLIIIILLLIILL